jgi:hypothetical protein
VSLHAATTSAATTLFCHDLLCGQDKKWASAASTPTASTFSLVILISCKDCSGLQRILAGSGRDRALPAVIGPLPAAIGPLPAAIDCSFASALDFRRDFKPLAQSEIRQRSAQACGGAPRRAGAELDGFGLRGPAARDLGVDLGAGHWVTSGESMPQLRVQGGR